MRAPSLSSIQLCSLPGFSVCGISKARILVWVAIFLLWEIFLTKRSNPCLLHILPWQADSLPLSHHGRLHVLCSLHTHTHTHACCVGMCVCRHTMKIDVDALFSPKKRKSYHLWQHEWTSRALRLLKQIRERQPYKFPYV